MREQVREKPYDGRVEVPAARRPWSVPWPQYAPPCVVSPVVLAHAGPGGWADPPEVQRVTERLRRSGVALTEEGVPLNPLGRHGLAGRGLLGRWGPNAAADPIVTREGRAGGLQLLVVERRDNGRLALPGGMRDPDEGAAATATRELREETGIALALDAKDLVYDGVVAGDWRNTDHAWLTTSAFHRHLSAGEGEALLPRAQDDARDACWLALSPEAIAQLNANHGAMLKLALGALRQRAALPPSISAQIDALLR